MRRAYKGACLLMNGEVFYGVSLGWDFCAEHEWGVRKIYEAFGIPNVSKDAVGADARTITEVPEKVLRFFKDIDGVDYLIFSQMFLWMKEVELVKERLDGAIDSRRTIDGELATAWDEGEFGVRTPTGGGLEELYEAFLKKDLMIYLAPRGNPFANRSLVVAIRSRVPKEILDAIRMADEARLAREQISKN